MGLNLQEVCPYRKSLKFLEERIACDNYRGNQVSQHNRYDINVVKKMLQQMYEVVGKDFMQIRDTDLSKRPYNIEGEEKYAKYTNLVNKATGRGTQDSIRKNLFVDFARMGFINRYDKNKNLVALYGKQSTKYVCLSDLGRELISNKTIFEQYMLYTRGIDNLFKGLLDDILDIILILGKFTQEEYTFFVSFVNQELNGTYYGKDTIIELVEDYRSLSKFQKDFVKERVEEYCVPNNFNGNKITKRDFHNWINETQQVFMLLNQTVYFEEHYKVLYPKVGRNAVFENEKKLKRSLAEKLEYFKYHNVNKKSGFELHHVVPLCWAKTREEFNILDNYKNLVYIDAYSHSKITQNRNRNVKLTFDGSDAIFTDHKKASVVCQKDINILYKYDNQKGMLEYNQSLLRGII